MATTRQAAPSPKVHTYTLTQVHSFYLVSSPQISLNAHALRGVGLLAFRGDFSYLLLIHMAVARKGVLRPGVQADGPVTRHAILAYCSLTPNFAWTSLRQ